MRAILALRGMFKTVWVASSMVSPAANEGEIVSRDQEKSENSLLGSAAGSDSYLTHGAAGAANSVAEPKNGPTGGSGGSDVAGKK